MTRIIAGIAKGRKLSVPKTGTRPTSDRVRESLFSMLSHDFGGDFSDLAVLDLFSGTGAIALEALSRGANRAVAVEHNPDVVRLIQANASATGLSLQCVKADVRKWVSSAGAEKFDLIFLDPPYEFESSALQEIVDNLAKHWVAPAGMVLIERSSRKPPVETAAYGCESSERKFGDTTIQKLIW